MLSEVTKRSTLKRDSSAVAAGADPGTSGLDAGAAKQAGNPESSPSHTKARRRHAAGSPDLVTELKIRARLGLKALRQGDRSLLERAAARGVHRQSEPSEWRLAHSLNLVARSLGFVHWAQALKVLGGHAETGDDMGSFWHERSCEKLLNHWFARYADAKDLLLTQPSAVLLPYRRQYLVVAEPYLQELGLGLGDLRSGAGHDLVSAYGTPAWRALCWRRLQVLGRA